MKKKQSISGLLLAAIMLGTFSCGGETPAADTETAPDTSAEALFTPTLKEELVRDGKWTLDVYGEMCAAVADDLSFSLDPADIYQRSGGDVPLQPLNSGGLDFFDSFCRLVTFVLILCIFILFVATEKWYD